MSANDMVYFSLRGEVSLAKHINGVEGPMVPIGNTPDFEISISGDKIEHTESKTGNDAVDHVMYSARKVAFTGTLDQISQSNLELVLSGSAKTIEGKTHAPIDFGDVIAGQKIKLEGFNVTDVIVTAGATTVEPTKYKVNAVFGTITFNESITGVKVGYTSGDVTGVGIASEDGDEYTLRFEGVNKAEKGERVYVELYRVKKSLESSFALIHSEYGNYSIDGDCLADEGKDERDEFGQFGYIIRLPKTP